MRIAGARTDKLWREAPQYPSTSMKTNGQMKISREKSGKNDPHFSALGVALVLQTILPTLNNR